MVGGSTGIAIAQYVALLGAVQGCLLHGHTVEAVQHVYDHFAGPGLEQPVLRRMFDGESVVLERRGGGRHVGLGDHDVHVMAGFGCTVGPQRVATSQSEPRAVLFKPPSRGIGDCSQLARRVRTIVESRGFDRGHLPAPAAHWVRVHLCQDGRHAQRVADPTILHTTKPR